MVGRVWGLAILAGGVLLAADPIEVRLWPGGAPNGWKAPASGEKFEERGKDGVQDRSLTNIGDPVITVFLPPPERRNGGALLIAPGGGYHHLAYDKEGLDIARWVNTLGLVGVVLKYRMPDMPAASLRPALFGDAKAAAQAVHVPVEDAEEAMRIIRGRAKEWGIAPQHVGMMGFSAGGHLAALMGMSQNKEVRPNFLALLYPAIPEPLYVTGETPTTFLAHADDDALSAENSVRFYLALKQAKVPAELHIFSGGGHGFGLKKTGKTSEAWPERFAAWLKRGH
jgi:acetyl esterase/lipase